MMTRRLLITLALLLLALPAWLATRAGGLLDVWAVAGAASIAPIWYPVPLAGRLRAGVAVVSAVVGLLAFWAFGVLAGAIVGLALSMALLSKLGSWHLARAAR